MTEVLTAAEMRAIEAEAMNSGKVSGLALMERAGRGVVEAIVEEWPALSKGSRRAIVLCGPGNNGGDGFVIARVLDEAGWDVQVHHFGDPAKLPPDAKANFDRWSDDHEVHPLTAESIYTGARPDLIVDAVFGIGLTRPLPTGIAQALDVKAKSVWTSAHKVMTIAVDCPSGLDLDKGTVPSDFDPEAEGADPWPETINIADLTVTFHAPKLGHYLGIGPEVCGRLRVVDIGIAGFGSERSMIGSPPDPDHVRLVAPVFAGKDLPAKVWPGAAMGKPRHGAHKYDHGHVIVFSGGVGKGGAARLAARTALRSGAGLVTVLCPPAALIENACHLDAVMLRSLAKDQPLSDVVDHRASGFCLGPGMGVSALTRQRVIEVLSRRAEGVARRDPVVVLDADALTSFADDPATLFEHTHARTILTPHEGEFARLFPDLSGPARRSMSKVDAVRQAAVRAGCVILLKGPDTVVAQPDGGASIHTTAYGRAAPWLATAGAGDVLAGLIAGLAAPHLSADLFVMAEIAAYLHVEAARRFGQGLIAEDLPEQLPGVLRDLGC